MPFRSMKHADHSSPLKKVVNTYQDINGNVVEVLECGHEIVIKEDWWTTAKKRRCKDCGVAKWYGSGLLIRQSEVRILPPQPKRGIV